jgi:hypothetical protein
MPRRLGQELQGANAAGPKVHILDARGFTALGFTSFFVAIHSGLGTQVSHVGQNVTSSFRIAPSQIDQGV